MPLDHFAIQDGCAYFRPTGELSWQSFAALMAQAMAECQAAQVTKLLVDVTATTQAPLTAAERFELFAQVASTWDRSIRFAMVLRDDQIDPKRFGELVARNRGLVVKGFLDEAEALTWLAHQQT